MKEHFSVTPRGELRQELVEIFGTDTLPINPPIPAVIELSKGNLAEVFMVDWDALSAEQRQQAIRYFVTTQGLSPQHVEAGFRTGFAVPAESCVMQRVTQRQVDMVRDKFRENLLPKHMWVDDTGAEAYIVSQEIIRFLLGYDWVAKNIANELGKNSKRVEYLRLDLATEQKRFEHQDRIIDLADSLFLLQGCRGFNLMINSLRKVAPAQPSVILMDKIVELTIAKLLVKSGREIEFVDTSRQKRSDFDLRITLEGTSVLAETKCKREQTADKAKSLDNTLRKARKQLPKGSPSVVFIYLHATWVGAPEFAARSKQVLRDFFRNTSRVNAIVYVWEEWVELPTGQRARLLMFRPEMNPSPHYPVTGLQELVSSIQAIPRGNSSLFLSFGEFGCVP